MADEQLLDMTTGIVTAYVANNTLAAGELPSLISSVYRALTRASSGEGETPSQPEVTLPTKAEIRKSLGREKLISFEDGRSYSTLKRHLSGLGMTPADYRAKWGLPGDYPMTAPAYSERRSELAKSLGLGSRGRGGKPTPKRTTRKK